MRVRINIRYNILYFWEFTQTNFKFKHFYKIIGKKLIVETLFQDPTQRVLSKYNSQLTQINRLGASFKNFTDQELREHTSKLKQQLLASDNNKESITNEAFAFSSRSEYPGIRPSSL